MGFTEAMQWLEAVYGIFGTEVALPASRVAAAEERLGVRLPDALRAYYQRTGAHRALHELHNRLVAPEQLSVVNEHLVFYEENQEVVVWGIALGDLSLSDPPVKQGRTDDEALKFYPEFDSLSEFSCAQGAWQAVQGGLRCCGSTELDADERSKLHLGSPDFHSIALDAWLVPGGVCVVVGSYVGLATHTEEAFYEAGARIGIAPEAWAYTTMDDDVEEDVDEAS